ncbi:MAG: gamma-glutamyltransferase [Alphaproteobacteria bacterium]|nr:gamma-glutamyltransferase [Alphaproteobacteria bacterium]
MRGFGSLLGLFLLVPTLAFAQEWAHFAPPPMKNEPPVEAANGMAVSAQHLASEVGAQILKQGGNAIDAAVAIGYALAVTYPSAGNIGGGGLATIHLANGRDTFINFREKAPLAASANMYLDAKGNVVPMASLYGYKAVAVPGTVAGLEMMLTKYGTMTRARLMAPAIRLAEEGFVLMPGDVAFFKANDEYFRKEPNVAAIFLKSGKPLAAGDRLVQKDLAATLKQISAKGPDVFYKGDIAARVVAASKARGGLLTMKDFASYTAEEMPTVNCDYRGYRIVSAPPPSSGGPIICEIANILSAYPMDRMGHHSAKSIHFMVEAMRHAYVDRNFGLGDPNFVKNPLDKILSPAHATAIRAKIDPVKATPSSGVKPGVPPHEDAQTTHYSVVDKDGNAVSITYTINGISSGFGAQVIAGNTGFFLNNEMDDFTSKVGAPNLYGLVQGASNSIQPGKRPLSSMSPTVVTKDGKLFMVTGSPGGSFIITTVLESILNVVDHKMNVKQAVDMPRLHHQWLPDVITAEPGAIKPEVKEELEAAGYKISEENNLLFGFDEAIVVGTRNGKRVVWGANDRRATAGSAVGY